MEARARGRRHASSRIALALAALLTTTSGAGATTKAQCQSAFMHSRAAATCTLVGAQGHEDGTCTFHVRCLTMQGGKADLTARVRRGDERALRNCNERLFLRPCPYEVSVERACKRRFARSPAAKWCTHIASGQAPGGGERCQITATCPGGGGATRATVEIPIEVAHTIVTCRGRLARRCAGAASAAP